MNFREIWSFIAGDSKFAPLGVALAVGVALALVHWAPGVGPWAGVLFIAVIAAGLIAGVFERIT